MQIQKSEDETQSKPTLPPVTITQPVQPVDARSLLQRALESTQTETGASAEKTETAVQSQPSAEPEMPIKQVKGWLDPWKELATTIVGLAGILYAIGFVLTNIYLLRYGISDFSLLKARYVATGALFVTIATLSIYPMYYVSMFVLEWLIQRKSWLFSLEPEQPLAITMARQKLLELATPINWLDELLDLIPVTYRPYLVWLGLLLIFLFTNLVSVIVYTFVSQPAWLLQRDFSIQVLLQAMETNYRSATGWYLACAIFGIILAITVRGIRIGGRLLKIPNYFWSAAGLLIALLWMIPTYAQQIHPNIASAFGGGSTVTVQLVADDKSAPTLAQIVPLESPQTDKATKTIPLKLLDENDKVFILILVDSSSQQERAVRVSKDLVKGVLFANQTQ